MVSLNISIYIYIYKTNTTDTREPTSGLAIKSAHSHSHITRAVQWHSHITRPVLWHSHITRAVLWVAAAKDCCFALKGQSSFSVSLHSLRPSRGPMTHVFVRLQTSPTAIPFWWVLIKKTVVGCPWLFLSLLVVHYKAVSLQNKVDSLQSRLAASRFAVSCQDGAEIDFLCKTV